MPEAAHCSYPVSEKSTDSSYGAKRCGLRLQDVWARPWDTRGFFRHDRRSAAGFTRCVGGDFYMPRKRDPQNAYRVRANIPTNSPDQLGTVILLIMKFSTPDFGPRGTDTHTCKPRARGPICQVDAIGLSQVREYVCTHTRVQTHDSKVSLGGASAPPIRVSGPASERQALCQLRRLGSVLLQHTAHPGRTLLAAVSP